ncbi:synaptosomal-associated protein 47 [Brienomyrus brachyistius]|uniref:synaptosomal-associated protein 47 n=1 Tax=Brienomyrus brachyistius TaxID=42636 RepID=UPI0020B39CD8|nr:synaptosomal-associated protein 47 [Brienomyrus brachyistius]
MSRDIPIHSWPGSYYINTEKRWVSGTLSLTCTTLRFTSDKAEESLASVRLSRIMEIKMESSSFIFSTLTVLEEGNVKHWFGSLRPNRVVVYNVLEHFWRERLLSPSGVPTSKAAPLSKGKELISLVSGAQRRLEDTGKVLTHQGEQFDNIMQGLDKIESDLGVADKLLSELESPPWWPFGKLPWKSQQEAKCEQAAQSHASGSGSKGAGRQGLIVSIPAIVSKGGQLDLKPGSLTVLVSSLEVRDSSSRLLHCFERGEVDDVRVHSPYELSVRQRFIGKPDISYRLLSARMPEVLSVLEMQYKKKVEFMPEYSAFQTTPAASPCNPEGADSVWSAATSLFQHCHETEVPMEVPAGDLTQLQVKVLQPTVTEAEAQELKQMLLQLKNLALEAESELERQDEALDVLASSTDRATMNIDRHSRRMRKLL